jgi:hypothetical protein
MTHVLAAGQIIDGNSQFFFAVRRMGRFRCHFIEANLAVAAAKCKHHGKIGESI